MTRLKGGGMEKEKLCVDVDFSTLISGLMAEAMAYMGMMDYPSMKGVKKDLKHAQTVVNTLGMLKEKTSGNLTQTESKLLEEILHHIRLAYVSAAEKERASVDIEKKTGDAE